MRLSYVADPPPVKSPQEQEIVDRIRHRRGPLGLVELDRTLLHSYPIADGWNSFMGSIRQHTSLTQDIREIIICRVAVLNHALYEWGHHYPLLVAATDLKVGEELGEMLQDTAIIDWTTNGSNLPPKYTAVLQYTDDMTRKVKVSLEVFAELKIHCRDDKEILEITATIASYNLSHAKMLTTLAQDD